MGTCNKYKLGVILVWLQKWKYTLNIGIPIIQTTLLQKNDISHWNVINSSIPCLTQIITMDNKYSLHS